MECVLTSCLPCVLTVCWGDHLTSIVYDMWVYMVLFDFQHVQACFSTYPYDFLLFRACYSTRLVQISTRPSMIFQTFMGCVPHVQGLFVFSPCLRLVFPHSHGLTRAANRQHCEGPTLKRDELKIAKTVKQVL